MQKGGWPTSRTFPLADLNTRRFQLMQFLVLTAKRCGNGLFCKINHRFKTVCSEVCMPIMEGIKENTTNIVSLERRLDREAIGQLRAEIVRLDAELTRVNEELAQAKSQLEWHQDSAEFWQDVAEMQRDGRQVGITQSGQAVAVNQPAEVIEKAARLIEENAEALLETSCLDGVWDSEGDEAAYLEWIATARELRGLADPLQQTTMQTEQ